jgi:hypothetical protein
MTSLKIIDDGGKKPRRDDHRVIAYYCSECHSGKTDVVLSSIKDYIEVLEDV